MIAIYQQVENYYLSPRIASKTIELNPGVAFGAAMAGGAFGGFVGAFFALPIAATIQTFLSTYLHELRGRRFGAHPCRRALRDWPETGQEDRRRRSDADTEAPERIPGTRRNG